METQLSPNTYQNTYLANSWPKNIGGSHTRITKVKPTKYGYSIQRFNTYVIEWFIKLHIYEDGSAKAQIRKEANYRPTERYTVYYAPDGREVVGTTTRSELNYWKKLREES